MTMPLHRTPRVMIEVCPLDIAKDHAYIRADWVGAIVPLAETDGFPKRTRVNYAPPGDTSGHPLSILVREAPDEVERKVHLALKRIQRKQNDMATPKQQPQPALGQPWRIDQHEFTDGDVRRESEKRRKGE